MPFRVRASYPIPGAGVKRRPRPLRPQEALTEKDHKEAYPGWYALAFGGNHPFPGKAL